MILAVDSETTGLDFRHGARPFCVTACGDDGTEHWWEWDVDPLTREVRYVQNDLDDIHTLVLEADAVVMHNAKFDVTALQHADRTLFDPWPWHKTHDTATIAHLLKSNGLKSLDVLAVRYLNTNINHLEDELAEAVKQARRLVKKHLPHWAIAEEGHPHMPSCKGEAWRYDYWLPKAVWQAAPELGEAVLKGREGWGDVLLRYARPDAAATLACFLRMREEVERRELGTISEFRRLLLPSFHGMEERGVTFSRARGRQLTAEYKAEGERLAAVCKGIARRYGVDDLELPKGGVNHALRRLMLDEDKMALPVVVNRKAKTDAPTLNKAAFAHYLETLPKNDPRRAFVKALGSKRSRDTAVQFVESYEKFGLLFPPEEIHGDSSLGDAGGSAGRVGGRRVAGRVEEANPLTKGGGNGTTPEVHEQSEEDPEVLGVDGRKNPPGVRPVQSNQAKGNKSTPGQLPTVQGKHTGRNDGSSQVRQPAVRKPKPSVPRDRLDQYEGHDSQGSGRQGEGDEAPNESTHRRSGDRAATPIRSGSTTSRIMPQVRSEPAARLRDRARILLEASVEQEWLRLYPSINMVGTDTLRCSSRNPNGQNISKKEDFNLRYGFGPAPGREWWSFDAKNIELRLPFYECGEASLIELFERPDDPPFYGSNHLMNFSVVYPEVWEEAVREVGLDKAGPYCKKRYADTYYQWCKNGGFAIQYGAVDKDGGGGTADRAFHRNGAHAMLKARFAKLEELNRRCIVQANRLGYVETIPDRTVDPSRGYPLECTRTSRGNILETVPLSYRIQGSAMWWTTKAMWRCDQVLDQWRREGFDAFITLQVHDEIVFDMPKRAHPKVAPHRSNLGRVRVLQREMEKGGLVDYNIPTPVGVEFHEVSYSSGISF